MNDEQSIARPSETTNSIDEYRRSIPDFSRNELNKARQKISKNPEALKMTSIGLLETIHRVLPDDPAQITQEEKDTVAEAIRVAKTLGLVSHKTSDHPSDADRLKIKLTAVLDAITQEYGIVKTFDDLTPKGRSRRKIIKATLAAAGILGLAGSGLGNLTRTPTPASALSREPTQVQPSPERATPIGIIKDIVGPTLLDYVQGLRHRSFTSEWFKGVNPELNKDRVNLVFLGLGIEDEEFTDSVMMLSYSLRDNSLNIINLPRDLHAPEVDRYRQKQGIPNPEFNAINMAYINGGYNLVREVIADATGLSPDLMVKSKIEGIVYLIADTMGEVEIDVPQEIDTTKVGFDFVWKKGKQTMSPVQLIHYARSRVTTSEVDRNIRQQEVVKALLKNFENRWAESSLWQKKELVEKLTQGLKKQQSLGNIEADFDIYGLIFDRWAQKLASFAQAKVSASPVVLDLPRINNMVLNEQFGLIPEMRAGDARPHLVTIAGGDFRADNLAHDFWSRFRQAVYERLTGRNKT